MKLHFDTGVYAKSKDIGTVITVGELAKELAKGADGKAFDTIEDAKSEILKTIKSGDVVLVKASHSMQFENIVEFSNRIFDLPQKNVDKSKIQSYNCPIKKKPVSKNSRFFQSFQRVSGWCKLTAEDLPNGLVRAGRKPFGK